MQLVVHIFNTKTKIICPYFKFIFNIKFFDIIYIFTSKYHRSDAKGMSCSIATIVIWHIRISPLNLRYVIAAHMGNL